MKRCICFITVMVIVSVLLAACAAKGEQPAATPDASSGVKTDWSQLTPYKPPEEIYTRLSEAPMPELIPSDDYGLLLPYIGARVDGYGDGNLYGFITTDGQIVTDAVYPLISLSENGEKPIYRLIMSPESDTATDWHRAKSYGVCAYDGSWVTSCIYQGVICLDQVLILLRDRETNEADVLDYDGHYLYALRDQAYFKELLPRMFDEFLYGWSDGLLTVPLADWSTILIDQRTGERVDTGFAYTGSFSEGLAPVSNNRDGTEPFGYVDRDFRLVIEPCYYEPGQFYNGKAVVRDENGDWLIIDKTGTELFRTTDTISQQWSGLYMLSGSDGNSWLGSDLAPLTLQPGFDGTLNTMEGSYWYHTGGETILCDFKNEYLLPGDIEIIREITGGFVTYGTDDFRCGIISLDGTRIYESEDQNTYTQTVKKGDDFFFMVNHSDDTSRAYALLDSSGAVLLEGSGSIRYDQNTGLFQITAEDFFGYCDETGRFVFKISLLQWLPD